jgi:hypothetical protein
MAASHKIRLDMETGKQMMAELKMWRMDPVYVGDPDIEEGGDEGAEEAEIKRLLSQDGIDDEDGEEEFNPMEQALSTLGADNRATERRKIISEESGVADYQVEADVESVQSDFWKKEYAGPDHIEAEDELLHDPTIPVNFYDNDDGFWTHYMEKKIDRWGEHDVLNNRKFFKH